MSVTVRCFRVSAWSVMSMAAGLAACDDGAPMQAPPGSMAPSVIRQPGPTPNAPQPMAQPMVQPQLPMAGMASPGQGPVAPQTPNTPSDPNMMDPNAMDPNMMDPNAMDPNMMDPNAMDPNAMDPNMMDPDMMDPPADRILPPVDSVDADGPFETTIDEGADNWVFRPAELGKDGLKHPVFVWGTGSTAVPRQYIDHFSRMASHGFVIVAPTPSQLNSRLMTASLDWILAENDRSGSPYYQQLDPDRVAMGGHSQGSTSTFDAEQNETRLKTTLHIAGGSFDGRGSSKVKTPTAYICGETDIALNNCIRDFQNVGDQPTFFSELAGVDHIQCAREALPGMIAWLRWHLADEDEWAAEFTGPDGMFHQGMWGSQTKNWNY